MNWYLIEVELQRRQDAARQEAEQYYRFNPFLLRRQGKAAGYRRLLMAVSQQLARWGCRLQARMRNLALSGNEGKAMPADPCASA